MNTVRTVLILALALPQATRAECSSGPEIVATIEIQSCNAADFDVAPGRMYGTAPGHFAGTLLGAKIVKSEFWSYRREPGQRFEREPWPRGTTRELFMLGGPSEFCERRKGQQVKVRTFNPCCDTEPVSNVYCLIPFRTTRVMALE